MKKLIFTLFMLFISTQCFAFGWGGSGRPGQNPASVNYTGGKIVLDTGVVLGQTYDVVVYGATPSGIMAAVAAKKEGAKVAIFEPTPYIGGMVTGGLSYTDIDITQSPATVVGLTKQFFTEIAVQDYGIAPFLFYHSGYNGEPHVYENRFRAWLQKWQIPVYTNQVLQSVNKTGTTITSGVFSGTGAVTSTEWIDATYEGDLLAASGCSNTIGREANATYTETKNGIFSVAGSTGAPQFADNIDPYVTPGNAGSGLLPGVWADSWGTTGAANAYVNSCNYRLFVTKDSTAGVKVTIPDPTSYDATQYELLGRQAAAVGSGWTVAQNTILNFNTLQGTQNYDVNNYGPMSTDYISPVCTEYITASETRRAAIREEVKQYTLGILKFMKTDTRIPEAVRTDLGLYAFSSKEFASTGGFSPRMYVREGRRMVGDFVLKETDITSANAFTDFIAYAYYAVDSHAIRRLVTSGMVKNEGFYFGSISVGASIPIRVIYPKVSEATNLLVPIAVSASHVAYSSLRMEPVLMGMGEAAGITAALAAARGIAVQNVPILDIQYKQNVKGKNVYGGAMMTVDGAIMNGTLTTVGSWTAASTYFGFLGVTYSWSADATGTQKFQPTLTKSGQYKIYIKYPVTSATGWTTATPCVISSATGTTTLNLNQAYANAGDGGDWYYIGTYSFTSGAPSANYVQIGTDGTGTGKSVISAIKWIPAE